MIFAVTMLDVFRNQKIERLSQKFPVVIAEHLLRHSIGEYKSSLRVDRENRLCSGFKQSADGGFAALQRVAGFKGVIHRVVALNSIQQYHQHAFDLVVSSLNCVGRSRNA